MSTWHPQCFTCEMCHKELADLGFIKNQGRPDSQYSVVETNRKFILHPQHLLLDILKFLCNLGTMKHLLITISEDNLE